jgi:hypothetical protein
MTLAGVKLVAQSPAAKSPADQFVYFDRVRGRSCDRVLFSILSLFLIGLSSAQAEIC